MKDVAWVFIACLSAAIAIVLLHIIIDWWADR